MSRNNPVSQISFPSPLLYSSWVPARPGSCEPPALWDVRGMADATHDHLFKLCLGWVGYCKGIFCSMETAVFPCYCCSSYFSCFCYYDYSYSCCCWWCQVGGWLFLVIVLVLFFAHCLGLVSLRLFFLLWFVSVLVIASFLVFSCCSFVSAIVVGLWILEGCEKSWNESEGEITDMSSNHSAGVVILSSFMRLVDCRTTS